MTLLLLRVRLACLCWCPTAFMRVARTQALRFAHSLRVARAGLHARHSVAVARHGLLAGVFLLILFVPDVVHATDQGPWAKVGTALCKLFFETLGKALAIVAVVIGGLMYAFGEGGSKSQIAGLAFGAGMVLMAPDFLGWILNTGDPSCTPTPGGSSDGDG